MRGPENDQGRTMQAMQTEITETSGHHGRAPVIALPERPGAPDRRGGDALGTPDATLGRITDQLSRRVGAASFSRYFDGRVSMRLARGRLEVDAPTRFMASLIGRRFGEVLREVTRQETGQDGCEVLFGVAETESAPTEPVQHSEQGHAADDKRQPRPRARRAPSHDRPGANPARPYSLDDFVVGSANQLAYDAALRIAEDEGPLAGRAGARSAASCSPLFIHGRCGMGKTHLLQGIAA